MGLIHVISRIYDALCTASDSSIIKDGNGLIYKEDGHSVGNPRNWALRGDIIVLAKVVVNKRGVYQNAFGGLRVKSETYTYPVLQVLTGTFTHQDEITAIKLPGITAIRAGAIADLPKLRSVSIDNVAPPEVGAENFTDIPSSATLLVPFDAVSLYRNHHIASRFAGVYAIGCRHPEASGHMTVDGRECAETEAFALCVDIRSLSFTATAKKIGEACFAHCMGLAEAELPRGLKTMGERAFKGCKALTRIDLPGTLDKIPAHAFSGCSSLTEVSIAEGVKGIGIGAFCDCTSLRSVTLPSSIEEVGQNAFSGCKRLTDITCLGSTPPSFLKNFANPNQAVLHVPKGSTEAYKKMNWRHKNFNKIKED